VQLEHIADEPHFAAVGIIQDDEHPTEGAYHYVRDPIRIDGERQLVRRHAPRLGSDTDEILSELGIDR
jgi:crotonobetainyl-CoA:carnitine CoA-transferase CaiB-like acyl-CoA transferase